MTETKIDGITVRMGGADYVVPALTLRQLKKLKDKLGALRQISPLAASEGQLEPLVDVIHAALSRNYPDLTREEMEDLIDLGNIGQLVAAVVNVSGLVPKGEVKAGDR